MASSPMTKYSTITRKTYSVPPSSNAIVGGISSNVFQMYAKKDISSDIALYGDVISVIAAGYAGVPVPASMDGNSICAPGYSTHSDNIFFFVTFAK